MEARRLPLGASPTQVAMMRWGEVRIPVSSYSSRTAPCSKLSPGCRRPAGGSQVPVGRWSNNMRPSSPTGKRPETRSAFKACSQGFRVYPPSGKYTALQGRCANFPSSRAHPSWQPRENVQALGEVEDRGCRRRLQAYLLRHGERTCLDLGGLEGPEMVVDFCAAHVPPSVRAVEAVALGQELLDGPLLALEGFSHGSVTGLEFCPRRAPVRPQASVVDLIARGVAVHLGVEVRQVERSAGETDGDAAAGVEGEEPDAGPAFRRHVGAEVYLGEVREPREGGQEVGSYAGHVEWYDAEPGTAFEGVDVQSRWHEGPERVHSHRPVHEEQIPPAHPEGPRTGRNRVGSVLYSVKNRFWSKSRKH